jgi:hypothetical protein|tara:strand:- start:451 stop:630 length:180 start_codon:yes stop_codon:yes gene_type:complete
MTPQDYIVIATLVVSLYLAWRLYEVQNELDNLVHFSVETIKALAEAIDEIEETLDGQDD